MWKHRYLYYLDDAKMRNGYMGIVVQIGNKLQFKKEGGNLVVTEYLDKLGEPWKKFVQHELKVQSDLQSRKLGYVDDLLDFPYNEEMTKRMMKEILDDVEQKPKREPEEEKLIEKSSLE